MTDSHIPQHNHQIQTSFQRVYNPTMLNQPLPSIQQRFMEDSVLPMGYQTPVYHYPSLPTPQETLKYPQSLYSNNLQNYSSYQTNQLPYMVKNEPTSDSYVFDQQIRWSNQYSQPSSTTSLSPTLIPVPPKPNQHMFQLPSQSMTTVPHIPRIELHENAVTKAIEAAEAFVANEVGYVPRRRRAKNAYSKSDATYSCQTCGKKFNRPYNLKSHQKTHSTDKPFLCEVCAKTFARSHDRKRHEKLHEGEKRFKCSGLLRDGVTRWGCNKGFARADALGRHFRTESGWLCIRPLILQDRDVALMDSSLKNQTPLRTDQITNIEINRLLQEKSQ